ncbi:MAG TPA: type II secretion system F family protein [Bacillota bacterium]|nr:type II secretion system F family protein [Bacillota bacterium]
MNPAIIASLVFFTIILFFLGISQLKAGERETVNARMQRFAGNRMQDAMDEVKKKNKNFKAVRRVLELAGKPFSARQITARVDTELAKADILLKGEEFLGLTLILTFGGGVFFLLITGNLLAGIIAASCGFYLPFFALRTSKAKRITKFNAQIGDALVIMANSLRSGFSFLQAMDMVCKELPDPIAKEFSVALQEMNWGAPTEESLLNMASRLGSEDLELVVTAVLIQRQVGGNLAEVLDNIATTIRERVRIKGEIKTLTAQGRMSGLVIGILPSLLTSSLYFLNPEYITLLFSSKTGIFLVMAAVIFQILGFALIRKIVQIPV